MPTRSFRLCFECGKPGLIKGRSVLRFRKYSVERGRRCRSRVAIQESSLAKLGAARSGSCTNDLENLGSCWGGICADHHASLESAGSVGAKLADTDHSGGNGAGIFEVYPSKC